MATNVRPIPEGYHSITPYLVVNDAAQAVEFYKKAFGAELKEMMRGPDGKSVMHCELKIGDSIIMLSDEFPMSSCKSPKTLGGTTTNLMLYVDDVDAVFNRAVAAGAKSQMPVQDMFWGDRYGKLSDPFGHEWGLATHKEDVAPEEMQRRAQAAFREMSQRAQGM